MENIVRKLEVKTEKPTRMVLENRKDLQITGITKVISINENNAYVLINGTKLNITGRDMSIEKLDVNEGILNLTGTINEIKYSGKNVKTSFFKRLFKWWIVQFYSPHLL